MSTLRGKRILILGGYGNFGSLIADQLVGIAQVTIAGRNQEVGSRYAQAIGAQFSRCDANDPASFNAAVEGADVVINASGPFIASDLSIPTVCIEHGCHYVDLADGRDYVSNFTSLDALARNQDVFACTGASSTPALTFALAASIMPQLRKVDSIEIYLTAGNKNLPGRSTFESILSYVGKPIRIWEHGRWVERPGWSMAEHYRFPPPVGQRWVQLCNVPDLELFPSAFGAQSVIFKAGVELPIYNFVLRAIAQIRRSFQSFDPMRLAGALWWFAHRFSWLGTRAGGLMVTVQDGAATRKSAGLVTPHNGPRIPSAAAVLMARQIIERGAPKSGAHACVGFIDLVEFVKNLEPFGARLVQR